MWRKRANSDDGIALIYVIFVTMILAGLATLFVARAVFEARATGTSANREAAIHVAEAGAENLLGDINTEGDSFASKVITEGPTPHTTTVADHEYDPPTGLAGRALQAWEESWAIALAEADWALGQDGSAGYTSRVIQTDEGQAFGIRAKHAGVDQAYDAVFGVGFVPSIDADHRQARVIKMLIARRFFSPDQALLAGGDLTFGGNAAILAPGCVSSGVTELDCNADVHSNGNVTINGTAHLIQGALTASGDIVGTAVTVPVGNTGEGEQLVTVPQVSARDFYGRQGITYNVDPGGQSVEWFDLCPNGTVRRPGATPCTGELLWDKDAPVSNQQPTRFRGWDWNRNQNEWQARAVEAGIFYVYHASAAVTGSSTTSISIQCSTSDPALCYESASTSRAVTIFVEENDSDPHRSGSLAVQGNPSLVAAFPDVLFVTENDLQLRGSAAGGNIQNCEAAGLCTDLQRYSGMILVGEQAAFAGTVNLSGALVVAELEGTSNVVTSTSVIGTLTLAYDQRLAVDLSGRVTIEFWNEL